MIWFFVSFIPTHLWCVCVCVCVCAGRIYTGLADGRIIRISRDLQSYELIVRTGENVEKCDSGGMYVHCEVT